MRTQPLKSPTLPERVAGFAESKIGLAETPVGSNRGRQIQEFFDSDDHDPNGAKPGDEGYPWCAAFVDRIVQLAMDDAVASNGRPFTFQRPRTPAAWGLERWSLAQDRSTQTKRSPGKDIRRGDLLVFTFSHCGIALGPPDLHGMVPTVEGNTNPAGSREGTTVMRKRRATSLVRSRIRFTV